MTPLIELESHLPIDATGHAICWATQGPFSHSALKIGNVRYEALVSKGYVKNEWTHRPAVITTKLPVTDNEYAAVLSSAENMVGTAYPNPWYLAAEYILPPLRDMRRRVYCSQAILHHLRRAGMWRGPLGMPEGPRASPNALFLVFEALASERLRARMSV